MKKIITALLLASMVLSFASCSSEKDNQDSGLQSQTTASDDSSATSESAVSDADAQPDDEPAVTTIDTSKLIYDFKGLDSEECITVLTSKKYYIRFRYDYMEQPMYQDLYYDNGKMYITTDFMGTKYSVLYQDKTQYTISDDMYCKTDVGEQGDIGSADMFEGFAYVESGETELEGTKYKYDEYYQTTTDSMTKMLLTDDNKVYAFQSGDKLMYIEAYSSDFDPDEKIAIPEGTREVSEEEFNTLFLEKLVGTEGVPAE
ncbi:MAG: hypothetical protein E7505_06240 [Ruminococcus sp.]|nr:hypothetical protein [Ruminococcus sp.]